MGIYYGTSTALSALCNIVGILAFLPAAFKNDLALKSNLTCELIWLARNQAIGGVAYHQMLITTDLTLNTLYFNRFLFLKRWQNVSVLVFAVQVAVAVSDSGQLWRFVKSTPVTSELKTTNQTAYSLSCTLPPIEVVVTGFTTILNRIIPAVFNTCMSIVIIQSLVRSKRNVDPTKKISPKMINFAVSLVAQNVIFIAMATPTAIVSALQISNTLTEATGDYVNYINVLYSFCVWGSYSYEALPFFMNLVFNRCFRNEIYMIVKCVKLNFADIIVSSLRSPET
jgi:hypothetical protein